MVCWRLRLRYLNRSRHQAVGQGTSSHYAANSSLFIDDLGIADARELKPAAEFVLNPGIRPFAFRRACVARVICLFPMAALSL